MFNLLDFKFFFFFFITDATLSFFILLLFFQKFKLNCEDKNN